MEFRRLFSSRAVSSREAAAFQELRTALIESQLFDPAYYLKQYPDVNASGIDPATHYIRHGGFEGRHPSMRFDTAFYLGTNPDVRDAKVNPLVHYLRHGRTEGRVIRALAIDAPTPVAPSIDGWQDLAAKLNKPPKQAPIVDVVVPVHSGFHETANCLYTLIRSRIGATVPCEIVAIDDRGPDPELSRLMDVLAALGLITLLRNENNLGFVASVNRGMALRGTRDVIVLNADTELYGDWVERLRRAAYSHDRIGTVTPFTNNGTFCSYPNFNQDFRGAFDVPFEGIDRLASKANARMTADIPAARGFCMYIRRQCLDEVGPFDSDAFGRGYGEETDFCQRIAARGWRNVLAGDVFVRHLGRISFGSSAYELGRKALEILHRRHPNYLADEAKFIAADPLKRLRLNIDIARIRESAGDRSILHVVHHPYGGTQKLVFELSRLLANEQVGSLLLRPWPGDPQSAELSHRSVSSLSLADRIHIKHDIESTAELLRALGVFHIHMHHYMGFPPDIMDFIQAVAHRAGIPYDFTMHDYIPVCPRGTMIGTSGVYCDNSNLAVCQRCVDANGSIFGTVDVARWRSRNEQFLAHARRVFVPNEDVGLRLKKFLPAMEFTLRPHPERVPELLAQPVQRLTGETLRIAVIGVVAAHKGSHHIIRCAQDAARRRLPINFVPFGFDSSISLPKISTIDASAAGRYAENDLPKLLADKCCHLAFFPAVWPETYCYTLSQALFAGLFPVAFDIGAIAQRIRAIGWGQVLPFSLISYPKRVNDTLLAVDVPPLPSDWRGTLRMARYGSIMDEYYSF